MDDDISESKNNSSATNGNADQAEIKKALQEMIQKGTLTSADIRQLNEKYKDNYNIVDEALRLYKKRRDHLKKKMEQLVDKLYSKINYGTPMHEVMAKAMKYSQKHGWTDAEFDEFRKRLSHVVKYNTRLRDNPQQNLFRSKLSRALGTPYTDYGSLNIKDSEKPLLNELLGMFDRYHDVHNSAVFQSLMYDDCAIQALTGDFDSSKNVASNHIHPVLAALFIPKFNVLDMRMIYSNIGGIVKARNESRAVMTEPDQLLCDDMVEDPNNSVCDPSSPIADLKSRYRVQINLWETVLKLRQGNYYEATSVSDFLAALNYCRNNLYDNADMVYSNDEGSILRRLFNVFSFRPTVLNTQSLHYPNPSYGMSSMMPTFGMGIMSGGHYPFNVTPVITVTQVPMITFHIPPNYSEQDGQSLPQEAVNLKTAMNQNIWINENKTIVPKEQSIVYSNEILVFYVNRRKQNINIKSYTNPLPFTKLPLTMNSFDEINKYPVEVPKYLKVSSGTDVFSLRSVVSISESQIKHSNARKNIITGCNALIISDKNMDAGKFEEEYYMYDPVGASIPVRVDSGYTVNRPVTRLDPYFTPANQGSMSFFERAQKYGTLYVYHKQTPSMYANG